MTKTNLSVVRFDDKLIYHGSYALKPRAVKVLCYIIARYINPEEDKKLPTAIEVPLTELIHHAIGKSKSKSIYQEIEMICDELTSKIHFSSGIKIDGYELRGFINWCSSAIPIRKDGTVYIRFGFDPLMSQFLLGLTQYVRLYRPEINRLKGSHAIRIFQMLKGIRNKKAKYEVVSRETYEVERLKFLLGIANKYSKFKDFRRWVVDTSIREINEKTTIKIIKINSIREGRKIKSLEFVFTDQQPANPIPKLPLWDSYTPSPEEIEALPWAKFNAYHKLVDYGVEQGIIYKQIIPTIKGSELNGFEDHFIDKALAVFEKKAKQKDAGTFVNWWTKKKVFDSSSDLWAVILEDVIKFKKWTRKNNPQKYQNRMIAKDMSKGEFAKWYQKGSNASQEKEVIPITNSNNGFSAIGDILSTTKK